MHAACPVPTCPAVPSPQMPKRRREIRSKPSVNHRRGQFFAEVLPEGIRIPHKNGGEHVLKWGELFEAAADVSGCTPRQFLDWYARQQVIANSGPSGPDHSTESGHGQRGDLA